MAVGAGPVIRPEGGDLVGDDGAEVGLVPGRELLGAGRQREGQENSEQAHNQAHGSSLHWRVFMQLRHSCCGGLACAVQHP
jgi:hypothetical protein